jgi:hypothetical protein
MLCEKRFLWNPFSHTTKIGLDAIADAGVWHAGKRILVHSTVGLPNATPLKNSGHRGERLTWCFAIAKETTVDQ